MGSREGMNEFLKEKKKGSIIKIWSVDESIGWGNYVEYAGSKGGLKLMMERMWTEYVE